MKTKFLLLMSLWSVVVQGQRVSNVDWKYDEADEKIFITYDLNKDQDKLYFDVSVTVNINGKTIRPKVTSMAGEIGKFQRIGRGKKIAWDIREYADQLDGANIQIEIIATLDKEAKSEGGNPPPIKKQNSIPLYAGLSTVSVTGLGLTYGGIKSQNNAQDDYQKTLADIDANQNLSASSKAKEKDTAFEEFNPKYKKGQTLLYGGLGVFAISSGILVYRLYWNKKLNNKYGSIYPTIQPDLNLSTVLVGVTYNKKF